MSAQQTDGQPEGRQTSVPETPEGAAAMLQSAIRHCIAAGLPVQARNFETYGLVIAVPGLLLDGQRITVRPVEPVTVPSPEPVP